jgi:hypothetical protein
MDVFNPNITLDPNDASGVNGSNVKTNTPDTTLGSTVNYIIDSNGIARSPQTQERATSIGLNAVAAFEGGIAVGAGAQSVAIGCTSVGTNSVSKVASATALGDQAQALVYRAIAIGKCANATGLNSIAIGSVTQASGSSSLSLGTGADASGVDSIAIGDHAVASDFYAIAIGVTSTASAIGSLAVGTGAGALAQNSIAFGFGAGTSGTGSIVIGQGASNNGTDSVVIGRNAQSFAPNQLIAGGELAGLSDVWFGQGNSVGLNSGTVAAYSIHGEEDIRADKAGGDVKIAGGRATGTGRGGAVRLQTSTTGTTSTTKQNLFDRVVVPARKSLTNNTTTELFRIGIPNPSSVAFEVKIGLSITDGTNVASYSATANVAATHDGAGYLSTITTTGATTQLGGGGSTLAVTLSMTQPATDIMAFNIKSNTGVITPSATVCYISVIISGETTVTIV